MFGQSSTWNMLLKVFTYLLLSKLPGAGCLGRFGVFPLKGVNSSSDPSDYMNNEKCKYFVCILANLIFTWTCSVLLSGFKVEGLLLDLLFFILFLFGSPILSVILIAVFSIVRTGLSFSRRILTRFLCASM